MSQKGLRTTIIVMLAVLVVVLVVLRVFNIYPPTDKTQGTIGSVEKVERFRGDQLNFEDIETDDPELTAFLQSAEFQNLLKDDEFRSFLEDPDKLQYVAPAIALNGLISQGAQNFQNFLEQGDNAAKFFGSKEYLDFYNSLDSTEVAGLIEPLKAGDSQGFSWEAQSLQIALNNKDFQKRVANIPFKSLYNQDIQNVFGPNYAALCAGDLETAMPSMWEFPAIDMQNVLQNETFQK